MWYIVSKYISNIIMCIIVNNDAMCMCTCIYHTARRVQCCVCVCVCVCPRVTMEMELLSIVPRLGVKGQVLIPSQQLSS